MWRQGALIGEIEIRLVPGQGNTITIRRDKRIRMLGHSRHRHFSCIKFQITLLILSDVFVNPQIHVVINLFRMSIYTVHATTYIIRIVNLITQSFKFTSSISIFSLIDHTNFFIFCHEWIETVMDALASKTTFASVLTRITTIRCWIKLSVAWNGAVTWTSIRIVGGHCSLLCKSACWCSRSNSC